jgi:hypothetical protein
MRKILINAAFLAASAGIAVAGPAGFPNPYFVAIHMDSGVCVITNKEPSSKYFRMMGKYGSMEDAHKAMGGMTECR